MILLKRIAVSILILGNTFAFAGEMGTTCISKNVTLPCEHTGWNFGAQALLLQAAWGELNYPAYQTIDDTLEFQDVSKPWNWGFMLEGGYHFSTGNDVNLNWYHLQYSNTTTLYGPSTSASTGAISASPTFYRVHPSWDAVNLELGHQINYGSEWSVRYHGGIEYINIHYQRYGTSLSTHRGSTRSYKYNGAGPRAGVDAQLKLVNNFIGYLKTAGGIYAGSSSFSFIPFNQPGTAARDGSSTLVVPEFEGKIGATYAYPLKHGQIVLDGGWLWINYINAITSADDRRIHISSFGLQGPYLGLKWMG